jgi:hypothetical protein
MGRFLDYATAKLGMADALRAMIAAGGDPYGNSQELTLEAISVLRHACESRTESDAKRQMRGCMACRRSAFESPKLHPGRGRIRLEADLFMSARQQSTVAGDGSRVPEHEI